MEAAVKLIDEGNTIPFIARYRKEVTGSLNDEVDVYKRQQERSFEILSKHPVNLERKKKGLNPANSFWFWGAGTKPALSPFYEKYKKLSLIHI